MKLYRDRKAARLAKIAEAEATEPKPEPAPKRKPTKKASSKKS